MARHDVPLKKTDSIVGELALLHDDISRRAYDLFQGHDGVFQDALDDWFKAERELVWSPAVELRQQDGQFELEASVAGIAPSDLDIQVTPEDILIKGKVEHRHEANEGTIHVREFQTGQLFRSIHLPERIDPDSVKAEHRNGLLRLTARIAKAGPRKIEIPAA